MGDAPCVGSYLDVITDTHLAVRGLPNLSLATTSYSAMALLVASLDKSVCADDGVAVRAVHMSTPV